MIFEWFRLKAEANLKKHGVSFEEAETAFDDEMQFSYPDNAHSIGERRFICLAMSDQHRLLMIVYTQVSEDTIRIISARKATRREVKMYAEQSENS
ncbi:MAG: BrnT family toxin [Blastocatellia bacterium]|nr:BrnT family toxin [Blastocatellia bacterium]